MSSHFRGCHAQLLLALKASLVMAHNNDILFLGARDRGGGGLMQVVLLSGTAKAHICCSLCYDLDLANGFGW